MKTIKSLKDITTLEVGDVIVFGNLEYIVRQVAQHQRYFLDINSFSDTNDKIFKLLNIDKRDFIEQLGIDAPYGDFPETKSLEALTAIVSALFKKCEKQKELPKTWEEFCERNPVKMGECLMGSYSDIYITEAVGNSRDADEDRNYYTSQQEAEAFLALMQLRQLRKAYVKDWEPDWNDVANKFCINFRCEEAEVLPWRSIAHPLSFPTIELAIQFLTNFRDLIKIAKPLL